MRRRITVSILVLVALTLVLTTAGSYYFIRRATVTTAQQELAGQARASSQTIAKNPDVAVKTLRRELELIAEAGAFAGIDVVRLHPDGTLSGTLPSGLTPGQLDVARLQQGDEISGHLSDHLVYAAVPTPLERATAFVPVLVITRQIRNPAVGLRYFALVGAIALLIAALVAAGLARRLTRPLTAAVRTTGRIASGDLDATVPVGLHDDPEFAHLAESINAMGANLVRARDQERQFILSVSHELRTPLTSIRGYADAILDGATDDAAGAAAVITAEASRLERLVQDLLDLARLDADRFSLDLGPVDVAALSRLVADGFRPRAAALGLELAVAGAPGPQWVAADPDRLAQILANLVENASSFAEHRIDVGTGGEPDSPVLWVADDGPGHPRRPAGPGLRAPLRVGPGERPPGRLGPRSRHRLRARPRHGRERPGRVAGVGGHRDEDGGPAAAGPAPPRQGVDARHHEARLPLACRHSACRHPACRRAGGRPAACRRAGRDRREATGWMTSSSSPGRRPASAGPAPAACTVRAGPCSGRRGGPPRRAAGNRWPWTSTTTPRWAPAWTR